MVDSREPQPRERAQEYCKHFPYIVSLYIRRNGNNRTIFLVNKEMLEVSQTNDLYANTWKQFFSSTQTLFTISHAPIFSLPYISN